MILYLAGYVGATHEAIIEVPEDELPEDEEERRRYIDEYWHEWMHQQVEGYWKEVD